MNEKQQSQLEKIQADLDQLKRQLRGSNVDNSPEKRADSEDSGEKDEEDEKNVDKRGDKNVDKSGGRPKLTRGRKLVLAGVVAALVIGVAFFFHHQHKYEETDDAYVQAYATPLSPKVAAIVQAVYVQENEHVRAGQVLAQLDPKDFRAALTDAEANLAALEAQRANAERDFHRSQSLVSNRAISRQQFDRDRTHSVDLERQTRAASAKVEEARLNLDYTTVRAPLDGTIARRAIDVGMFVPVGSAIFGFVPRELRWVDANFKETQLEYVQPGRPVEITVDAIPGKRYAGTVESVSPATGASFTLMPPDNATGNFTKVVQRVPVRIRIENLEDHDYDLLQAGLSANVAVLKHEPLRKLPPPPAPVFAAEGSAQDRAEEE